MASGNAPSAPAAKAAAASGNTTGRGRPADPLPAGYAAALAGYAAALASAPLAADSRANYLSRVRGYLHWLAAADVAGDPLAEPAARDWAVRDYRVWLKTVAGRPPTTVNNTLAALDDFSTRGGLRPAAARREPLARRAPHALDERAARRYLREAERCPPRDRLLALLPYYAGLRVDEVVTLDVADVRLSARKGELVVRAGKGRDGGKRRSLPAHPALRTALQAWLTSRAGWPGADATDALLLNRRGQRLTTRSARTVITRIGQLAGLGADPAAGFGPHVLRHTFATQLVRPARTSSWSQTCSATNASTPHASTPNPATPTGPTPSAPYSPTTKHSHQQGHSPTRPQRSMMTHQPTSSPPTPTSAPLLQRPLGGRPAR